MSSYYPVFLDLRGQQCVVIGAGETAAAKARELAEAGAEVRTIGAADYRTGDLAGARLAIDVSGDAGIGRQIRADADAAGVLLNIMDKPRECDFIAPAILQRGPLQVAVSTSGESPALAQAVRDGIGKRFGAEWGDFVALVGELRRDLRQRGVSAERQRAAYDALVQSNIPQLLNEGAVAAARRQAKALVRRAIGERHMVEAG